MEKVFPKKTGASTDMSYMRNTRNSQQMRALQVVLLLLTTYGLITLVVQLDNFPNAKLLPDIDKEYYINFSVNKDETEAKQNVTKFLDGLNKFYEEIDFKKYIDDTRPFYESSIKQVMENLPDEDFVGAMEEFYKKSFNHYTLIPSLTIPKGMGFGLKYTSEGKTNVLNVFGAFDFQSFSQPEKLDMGFANAQRLRELSIHEFGHSFVNPIVDELPSELITSTEKLFEPIKDSMSEQGYNSWKVCLYEHFVRAGEIVIAKQMGDYESAERIRSDYIYKRNFRYLQVFISKFEEYTKDIKSYSDTTLRIMDELMKLK
jgi:hypothetical protein